MRRAPLERYRWADPAEVRRRRAQGWAPACPEAIGLGPRRGHVLLCYQPVPPPWEWLLLGLALCGVGASIAAALSRI